MIKPLNGKVLIRMLEKEQVKSVLILKEEEEKERGEILEIADDVMIVKKGDKVLFSPYGIKKVEVDEEELLICEADELLAKLS